MSKPKRRFTNRRHADQNPAAANKTLAEAEAKVRQYPGDSSAWEALADAWLAQQEYLKASEAISKAIDMDGLNPEFYRKFAAAVYHLGEREKAESLLQKALELSPKFGAAHHAMAYLLFNKNNHTEALEHVNSALESKRSAESLSLKGAVLKELHRHAEALEAYEEGLRLQPGLSTLWNNYGNTLQALGRLDEAVIAYRKALDNSDGATTHPFSNLLTTAHYHPGYSQDDILAIARQWNQKFAPKETPVRPCHDNVSPEKCLRIGLISSGFRNHPVGRMTVAVLEELANYDVELYFYSTTNHEDFVTSRFKTLAANWMSVEHLDDARFAQQVRDHKVDILFDLAGHNSGNRMLAMAMEPAPLLVKWVGGLINTTGIEAMDYLISDSIESPRGVDQDYVEKLIRLPDDYICYTPQEYAPEVSELPAFKNGYVTFGCFNNATKINEVVLSHWAGIMRELPKSRLFLKSLQYNSEELCQRVREIMAGHGVEADRLIIEGPSPNLELLKSYNRVDIALDPWPYSGGLSTCEAFLMGVPVVSLPGPTFAGRHSATHLVNAGMPELVVNSWNEYRERVLELASDLNSLSTIRQHLRDVLLQSPVCDAPRFAKHFATAIRAIWQRYCEGKAPAALTFDKDGKAWFEDESQPIDIVCTPNASKAGFNWQLTGKIIAIDNSAKLLQQSGFKELLSLKAFGVVAFDPGSRVENPSRFEGSDDVQLFPHAVLGDGQPATLYACLDPEMSSTLAPLPPEQLPEGKRQGAQVLATLPINTIALDSIEGLESLDWLILDDLNDAMAVLENGENALKDTLLIQVRIAFQPTHKRQPNLAEAQHWMARHGFRFYRFNDMQYSCYLPDDVPSEQRQATELVAADALFLPSHERMDVMQEAQLKKLAFLLHTVFSIRDMAYVTLRRFDEIYASNYLQAMGIRKKLNPLEEGLDMADNFSEADAKGKGDDSISSMLDDLLR